MSTLKAYEVRDDFEGHCVIQFASSNAAARREGAEELGIDWASVEHCRRAPQYDEYSPGPVPPLALVEGGWWFECSYHDCGRRVTLEEQYDDEGDELPAPEPVAIGQSVFCCAEHAAKQMARLRGRKAAEAALCELIYTRFPEAEIVHVRVYGDRLEPPEYRDGRCVFGIPCSANFKLPGITYPVTYNFGDDDKLYVSQIDVEAFKALYGSKS